MGGVEAAPLEPQGLSRKCLRGGAGPGRERSVGSMAAPPSILDQPRPPEMQLQELVDSAKVQGVD